MDSLGLQLAVLLWLLILGQGLIATRFRGRVAGAGTMLATWLVVSTLVLWIGGTVAFVLIHVLLFTLGPGAAWAGLLACGAALVAGPVVVAVVLRRRSRRAAASGLLGTEG